MSNYNKVILLGNLTKDPETKFTPSAAAVCTLRLAVNHTYRVKGEIKEEATFVNIITWGPLAKNCQEYLKKGSSVLVDGRLQGREWEDDKKVKHSILEVVAARVNFMDKKTPAEPEPESAEEHTNP